MALFDCRARRGKQHWEERETEAGWLPCKPQVKPEAAPDYHRSKKKKKRYRRMTPRLCYQTKIRGCCTHIITETGLHPKHPGSDLCTRWVKLHRAQQRSPDEATRTQRCISGAQTQSEFWTVLPIGGNTSVLSLPLQMLASLPVTSWYH